MSRTIFPLVVFLVLILPLSSAQDYYQDYTNDSNYTSIFNVTNYGAVGDGISDDTKAFRDAWDAACKATGSPVLNVPGGANQTYLLQPLIFAGKDCNFDAITVLIDGDMVAPSNSSEWKCSYKKCRQWIAFAHVDGLHIRGSGKINGRGQSWWDLSCNIHHDCPRKPTTLVIGHCSNVRLSQLSFQDSPQMHIALENSRLVHISGLNISASSHSPNTDGIHIQNSKHVSIEDTQIGTGDDCVSIGDGSAYLNISKMACGPGHGISIGSLGKNGRYETVEFVHVYDVAFTGTTNGVRIKTWQGGSGYARNIHFERIASQGSTLPIVIDQNYCDHKKCEEKISAVQVSNVTYNQIWGTSHKRTAVKFACSNSFPCTNIVLNDVDINTTDEGDETTSYCLNAQGTQSGLANPSVSCLARP